MIKVGEYYVRQADLDRIEELGITFKRLKRRISDGWTLEEAVSTPRRQPRKSVITPELKDLAASNGITYHLLYRRIKKGIEPHKAATTPFMFRRRRKQDGFSVGIHYVDAAGLAIMEEAGVCKATVLARVTKLFWPIEKAISTPPNQNHNWRKKKCNTN